MMTNTTASNELILEEIRTLKQELKAKIEAVEVNILLKIEEVSRRLNKLELENKDIQEKFEYIERTQRKNNIIIFGLKEAQQVTPEFICEELKKLTNISVSLSDLNNVYPLGKQENSPIKVEFLSYLKKTSVLKCLTKTKLNNISIANDLTAKQRGEYRILRKHLHLAKQNKANNCYIKKYKLYVNDEVYTPADLEHLEDENDEPIKSNSAPGTPSTQTNRKPGEKTKEEKNKTLKSTNLLTTRTTTQTSTTPTGNKLQTKQVEKQIDLDKRKTRSGSTSTSAMK